MAQIDISQKKYKLTELRKTIAGFPVEGERINNEMEVLENIRKQKKLELTHSFPQKKHQIAKELAEIACEVEKIPQNFIEQEIDHMLYKKLTDVIARVINTVREDGGLSSSQSFHCNLTEDWNLPQIAQKITNVFQKHARVKVTVSVQTEKRKFIIKNSN